MSFKDQLMKAGLVSKKQVRKANQGDRSARKKKQSSRESKAILKERSRAERKAKQKQLQAERLAAKRASDRAKEAAEAKRRVDQILGAHRVRFRSGQQPFWYRAPDGRHALKLSLPDSVAFDLHVGKLAVAYRGLADAFELDVILIPRDVADRVEKIDPSRVLFRNSARPDGPDEALWSAGVTS